MIEQETRVSGWTSVQAYTMAVICLLLGVTGGYLFRGSGSPAQPVAQQAAPESPAASGMGQQQITPQQLKQMADQQAQPLLEKLKTSRNDSALLASIGNVYYDAQVYPDAISYYERSLKIQPNNVSVRTDMGTAEWFLGEPDKAIEEFQAVLKVQPTMPSALFNLGVVQWRGKMDSAGAIATWQKLLETNPTYENKEQVQQLIAQAQKHMNIKPGSKTDKPTT